MTTNSISEARRPTPEGELHELACRMKTLQERKAELEEILKNVNADLDEIRLKKIPAKMESLGVQTISFAGLGRLQLAADLFASTREGQKGAAMQWLRDCGYGDMISETYNASSIKALFRRMIADGADVPADIFNVSPFIRASLVKA